jgi:rhamnosyl/mannosyltransferase
MWLSVGRCVYYKGQSTAIAALTRVPGKLLIIGNGPLRAKLERQARDAGVADRVVFFDHATDDELAGAYLAATALWFPSNARSEAFGLVQVEAMASGCPVINTRIPGSGVAWVCPDGRCGLTVEPDDPAALAAAARRLLGDADLRQRLTSAARVRALEEFTADRMAARSLAVYSNVLQQAASAGRVQDAVAAPTPRLSRWVRRFSSDEDRQDAEHPVTL